MMVIRDLEVDGKHGERPGKKQRALARVGYGDLVYCMVTTINNNEYLKTAKELHPTCACHKRKGSMERNMLISFL